MQNKEIKCCCCCKEKIVSIATGDSTAECWICWNCYLKYTTIKLHRQIQDWGCAICKKEDLWKEKQGGGRLSFFCYGINTNFKNRLAKYICPECEKSLPKKIVERLGK